jgi:hypothetical protein
MARYILLRIEDNGEADSLVEAIGKGHVFAGTDHSETGYRVWQIASRVEVRGLFAAPTKFCDCSDKSDTSARSANFGWWVHLKCKKPKKGNMQHPYNLFGRNELGKNKPELYIGVTEPWTKEDK